MERFNKEQLGRAIETAGNVGQQQFERPSVFEKPADATTRVPAVSPLPPADTKTAVLRTDPHEIRAKEIENVLEEDLGSIYFALNDAEQIIFRASGEQTAKQINSLLDEFKIQTKKIADLIRNWLKQLPGINVFFLEQETKIKTDKIINRYLK